MAAPFTNLEEFMISFRNLPSMNEAAVSAAIQRDAQLTKPRGALGRLEEIAIWLAGWQGRDRPRIDNPQVAVFAANHGVAALGVSAFPAEVTAQMVTNFQRGGAAINQLSQAFGARMSVHPIDLDRPTADFTQAPALSESDLVDALRIGWDALDPASDLLIVGEMGIGNTTSAAALAAALLGGEVEDWAGRGTGVDDAGLARKCAVIRDGLARHAGLADDPLRVLQALGGREIAAMTGAIAHARLARVPVLLDGFICCSAALVLHRLVPGALDHCLAGHVSAEAGHARLLSALGKEPILSLGLRLGEASGAALALGILKGAVACHSGMATFAEAGVSDG